MSEDEAAHGPSGPKSEPEPTSPGAQLWNFVKQWGFIGACALIPGSYYWGWVERTPAAPWLVAALACVLIFISAHNLFQKSHWRKRWVLPSLLSVCVLVGTQAMSPKGDARSGNFKFRLAFSDRPGDLIEITNHVHSDFWAQFPILMIPIQTGQSHLGLSFVAQNTSSQTLEYVEFLFQYNPQLTILPSADWLETKPLELKPSNVRVPTNLPFALDSGIQKGVTYRYSEAILAGKGVQLPPINISNPSNVVHCSFRMRSQTKTSASELLLFSVAIVPMPKRELPKPFWQTARVDSDGAVVVWLPPEWLGE